MGDLWRIFLLSDFSILRNVSNHLTTIPFLLNWTFYASHTFFLICNYCKGSGTIVVSFLHHHIYLRTLKADFNGKYDLYLKRSEQVMASIGLTMSSVRLQNLGTITGVTMKKDFKIISIYFFYFFFLTVWMNEPAVPFYPLKFCEMNFHFSTIRAQIYTYCII